MNVFLVHPGRSIPPCLALGKTKGSFKSPQADRLRTLDTDSENKPKSQCRSFLMFSCRFTEDPPRGTVMVKCDYRITESFRLEKASEIIESFD